jgi:hypothetical protein
MVLFALEAFIGYVGPQSHRLHAPKPWVGFRAQKVSVRVWSLAEAEVKPVINSGQISLRPRYGL